MKRAVLSLAAILLFANASSAADRFITIRGSRLVGEPIAAASEAMKEAIDIEYRVVGDAAESAIYSVGEGVVDIALSTRPLAPEERANWPSKTFNEALIGKQAVVFVVPKQVWEGGIRALTKEQFRQIYEGEVKNWKELGGPDRTITFFNRSVGQGIWDLAMIFIYEQVRRAPLSKAEVLATPKEVITSVEFNGGSISMLEFGSFKPTDYIHALGIKLADGSVVEPTLANIADGKYALSRPLLIITSKRPTGKVRDFIEFMQSKKGQVFIKDAGHVPLADLKTKE